jgi:hypothetical protein
MREGVRGIITKKDGRRRFSTPLRQKKSPFCDMLNYIAGQDDGGDSNRPGGL